MIAAAALRRICPLLPVPSGERVYFYAKAQQNGHIPSQTARFEIFSPAHTMFNFALKRFGFRLFSPFYFSFPIRIV